MKILTRGMKILRGGSEHFKTPKREAVKKLGGGGLHKFVYFKKQQEGGS